MRTQKIITIDACIPARTSDVSHHVHAIRQDEKLDHEIKNIQIAYENWDLLSVAPAGSYFPSGFYTTTWEYDPELHEDVKTDSDSIAEDDCAIAPEETALKPLMIMDEVEGFARRQLGYINNSPYVGKINHGDIIMVNGEYFRLSEFGQNEDGARVEFVSVREENQRLERGDDVRGPRGFVRYARPTLPRPRI